MFYNGGWGGWVSFPYSYSNTLYAIVGTQATYDSSTDTKTVRTQGYNKSGCNFYCSAQTFHVKYIAIGY